MSTTPNQKDLLAKKTDLEGILKPDANDVLHLPDITITLAENGQFYLAGINKKLLTLIGNTSGNAITLDGDAGLTFTTSGGSSTITGITSSSGNSTSLAASQSMVSAKQDALTAGTNITISNNTISATDTNTLSDLTDTAISSLADGQVLKYNATSGKWVNGTGGGGAEVILGTTAPTAAQGSNGNLYIQYDDTNNNTVTHEYVKISGAWEEIAIGGGGSSVIANPGGTATDSLSSIEIDGTIYSIEGGGGGSGTTTEEIYKNTAGTIPDIINLTKPINDFDIILISGFRSNTPTWKISSFYVSSDINQGDVIELKDDAYYAWYTVTDLSTLTKNAVAYDVIDTIYGLKLGSGGGGGGDASADEVTLAEYNTLTPAQKNDGTIRFIPESNIGSSAAINMSNITKFKEVSMDTIATSSSETTITWDGGSQIGNTYYYTTAIDVTDYDNIIFDLTTRSCYGGGSSAQQTRWNIQVGLMSIAPAAALVIDATDNSWTVCKDFANSNTVYSGQELDVSELTGSYYLVINAHGWNATLENFILATVGGNSSQIKYMDKTYANNSGGGTTVVANPQDPATDTLTKIQIGNTIYEIEGGGSSSGGLRSTTLLSTPITATGTYTLADSYTNYDFIGFRAGNGSNETDILLYPVKEITDAMNDSLTITNPVTNSWFNFTISGSSLVITGKTVNTIYSVIGYKISGGGGGSGGFITYSTTATLTQYGWWTVEDKDGNTLNPDDYIIIDISVSTDNSSSWNGAYDVLWYHETGNNNYAATFVDINDGRFPRSSGSFPITVTYAPKDGGGASLPNNYTVTADSLKINNEAPSTGVDWTVEDDTDYFDSAASITISTRVYQKTNAVPALGGVYTLYASGNTWTTVMFTSTDATAVAYSGNADPFGSFTYLGYTWYFSGTNYAMSGDNSSAVSGARYIGDFSQYDYSTKECCIEAAKYLIDHAGVSFEENNFTTISRPSTGYIIAGGGSASDFSDATFKVTKQGNIYSKGNLLEDIFQKKSQELTSSQYENLTLAEKTNGTIYFINDPIPGVRQLISRVSAADSHITSSGHSGWGGEDWHAFDGITGSLSGIDNAWCALENDATPWIQYHFDTPYYFTKLEMKVYCHYGSDGKTVSMNILASNDGTNWDNISMSGTAVSVNFPYQTLSTVEFDLNNGGNKYEYIRIQGTEPFEVAYSYGCDFDEIYVYGTDQGSPVKKIYYMNSLYAKSNDSSVERKYLGQLINRVVADDSHIIKSSENSRYPAWGAFSGVSPTHFGGGTDPESNTCWLSTVGEATPYLGYHFDTPYYFTKIDIKCFSNYSTDWVHNIQVLGSKDGNSYENILAEGSTYELTAPYLTNTTTSINLNETDTYSYIKVVFSSPVSIAYQPSCFVDEIYVYGGEIVEDKKDLHTYSTTEQAIGTWIDGKTLYEKTYHYPGNLSTGSTYLDQTLTSSNVDYFTYCNMSYVINNNYRGSGFQVEMGVFSNGIFINPNNAPQANYSDIYVTVRYTKIT